MFRTLIPAFIFTILVVFFWVGLTLDPSKVPSPLIGEPAPAFTLPSLQDPGTQLTEQNLHGRVSLLNVWATWCVGCRQEHDMLLTIAGEGLAPIYGLNYKDERANALNWLRQLGDPYEANAFDHEGATAIDWGVYGAPETFLIDASGIVRYKHIGPLTPAVWREELRPRIEDLKQEGA